MKPIGETNLDWQARVANAAWRARALEKPSGASDLRGESRPQPDRKSSHPQGPETFGLRQSGTPHDVPFRDARRDQSLRLTAPFTAQLLGQILPDPERRASAVQAYGREPRLLSLGFDKRL